MSSISLGDSGFSMSETDKVNKLLCFYFNVDEISDIESFIQQKINEGKLFIKNEEITDQATSDQLEQEAM